MIKTDYLRFALVLSDGHAKTLRTNLEKIIINILLDTYGVGLDANSIVKTIKDTYALEFTADEVFQIAIKSNEIVSIKNAQDSILTKFDLLPQAYQKAKERSGQSIFGDVLFKFCKNHKEISQEKLQDIIVKYVYYSFEQDKQTLMALMNPKAGEEIVFDDSFSTEEQSIINLFLDWDNEEKDKLIWNLVSIAYEYCMMTIKKDDSAFKNVFNGKTFILDTNIILGLIGVNKEHRKNNYQAFIDKCKEQKIKCVYTNITKNEAIRTIENYVQAVSALSKELKGISVDAVNQFIKQDSRQDFYSYYVKLVRENKIKVDDFNGFKRQLLKMLESVLSQFDSIVFDEIYISSQKHYEDYLNSYKGYKTEKRGRVSNETVKTDVQNFLLLRRKNEKIGSVSFIDINYFIITADKCFVQWAEGNSKGMIPAVVFPNIWYSIMLKFTGRSVDDFKSYSQFIKFNLYDEKTSQSEKREDILMAVSQLDESTDIKTEIIFDINNRLTQGEYILEGSVDINNIIEQSHEYVTQKKIEEAKNAMKKEENIRLEQEKRAAYSQGKKDAQQESVDSKKETLNKQIEYLADKKIKRNKIVFLCLIFIAIALFVVGIVFLVVKNKSNTIVSICSFAFTGITTIMACLFKKFEFLSFDKDIVKNQVADRIEKKHIKLEKKIEEFEKLTGMKK